MESSERYYRRRAVQELAAARIAVTEDARKRRRQLADVYLDRLAAITGIDERSLIDAAHGTREFA